MHFIDDLIKLRDGRNLAYTEVGAPGGEPVFMFHGNPGSRYFCHPDLSIAESLNARVITPDRPGYGKSDYQPGRRLIDFPQDIVQLADKLGIERFSVIGVSAGGPYAACCAYSLADRLNSVSIVSGAAPFRRKNAFAGMAKLWKDPMKAAMLFPEWLMRFFTAINIKKGLQDPEAALKLTLSSLTEYDRSILTQPEFYGGMVDRYGEPFRQGSKGFVRELKVLVSDWGFRLEDIRCPVHLWYWDDDPVIPPQMGKYLESLIPDAIPHFLPGGGHMAIWGHWHEILENALSQG